MTFTLSEEQQLLKDSARDFFREQAPVARLRKLRDARKNGKDPELWREMAAMGWAGVIVPEEFGGAGLGYVALGAVLEESGRTLVASPLHATALAGASALMLAGTDAQKAAWLPKIAAGQVGRIGHGKAVRAGGGAGIFPVRPKCMQAWRKRRGPGIMAAP